METHTAPIVGGGIRRTYRKNGNHFATVVILPGTLARIYWPDGRMEDYKTLQGAYDAVEDSIVRSTAWTLEGGI